MRQKHVKRLYLQLWPFESEAEQGPSYSAEKAGGAPARQKDFAIVPDQVRLAELRNQEYRQTFHDASNKKQKFLQQMKASDAYRTRRNFGLNAKSLKSLTKGKNPQSEYISIQNQGSRDSSYSKERMQADILTKKGHFMQKNVQLKNLISFNHKVQSDRKSPSRYGHRNEALKAPQASARPQERVLVDLRINQSLGSKQPSYLQSIQSTMTHRDQARHIASTQNLLAHSADGSGKPKQGTATRFANAARLVYGTQDSGWVSNKKTSPAASRAEWEPAYKNLKLHELRIEDQAAKRKSAVGREGAQTQLQSEASSVRKQRRNLITYAQLQLRSSYEQSDTYSQAEYTLSIPPALEQYVNRQYKTFVADCEKELSEVYKQQPG